VPWCLGGYKQKKPPFPNKERRLYNPKQRCCEIHSISVGVPYARTLNKFMIPTRFSDLRSPKEPFPSTFRQWYNFFWSTNAYSGATVTALNRVPFFVINIFFLKEQA
jgi:hypothetical protein